MSRFRTTVGLLLFTLSGISYLGPAVTSAQAAPSALRAHSGSVSLSKDVSRLGDWSFWPPEGEGAPERTASGASRNGCTADSVIPLVPESQYGLTGQTNPSILAYVSDAETSRQLMFSLKSDDGYYFDMFVEVPNQAGLIKVSLPDDAPALDPATLYQWSLIVICDNNLRPDSPSLQGWLETAPVLESEVAVTAGSLDQASSYRDQHLWYDMIVTLADLQSQDPSDVAVSQAWQDMLAATGLDVAVAVPLVD